MKTLNFRVLKIYTSSGFVFGLTAVIHGQVLYFKSSNARSVYIEMLCSNGNGIESVTFRQILKITPSYCCFTYQSLPRLLLLRTIQLTLALGKVIFLHYFPTINLFLKQQQFCDAYRPITVCSTIGKLLERLISNEISPKCDHGDSQFGFWKGLGAQNTHETLLAIFERL